MDEASTRLLAFGNIPFLAENGLTARGDLSPASSPGAPTLRSRGHDSHIHEIWTAALAQGVVQIACATCATKRTTAGRFALFLTGDGDVYKAGEKVIESNELEECVKRPPLLVRTLVRERALRGRVVTAVACGPAHAAAVTSCGKLLSWGNSSDGRLGHGDRRKAADFLAGAEYPQQVMDLSSAHITQCACGASHTVALTAQGDVYTWGRGANGRLGHGNSRTLWKPKLVDYFTDKGWRRRGGAREQARKSAPESRPLWNLPRASRRLSLQGSAPTQDPKLQAPTISQVAAGAAFTVVISACGNAFCFGAGDDGQCATPIATDALLPVLVKPLAQHRVDKHIIDVAAGAYHAVVLCSNGDMYSWGYSEFGALGTNSVRQPLPARIVLKSGILARGDRVASVVSGPNHCAAVTMRGALLTWGRNDSGQLGGLSHKDTADRAAPALTPAFVGRNAQVARCGPGFTVVLERAKDEDAAGSPRARTQGEFTPPHSPASLRGQQSSPGAPASAAPVSPYLVSLAPKRTSSALQGARYETPQMSAHEQMQAEERSRARFKEWKEHILPFWEMKRSSESTIALEEGIPVNMRQHVWALAVENA